MISLSVRLKQQYTGLSLIYIIGLMSEIIDEMKMISLMSEIIDEVSFGRRDHQLHPCPWMKEV